MSNIIIRRNRDLYIASRKSGVFLNPAIDWSMRNNTEGYTGAYIRVRDGATSNEWDVGGVNNYIDESFLESLPDNLRVVRVYNKGSLGSNFDLVQTSGGSQPFIKIGGDIVMVNGKVGIDFSQGNHFFETAENDSIMDNDAVWNHVFESQNGASVQGLIEEQGGDVASRVVVQSDTRSFNFNHSIFAPSSNNIIRFTAQQPQQNQRQFSNTRIGDKFTGYAENVFIDEITSTDTQSSLVRFRLGRQSAGPLIFNGKWQESLVDTDPTRREEIDLNQMNFYGV